MTRHATQKSNHPWNVDICAAIVADKPPQLPLREELISLGFEIVLAAAGTGIRASKYESKLAVQRYRQYVATKELKKRRFFPKSSQRIRETLAERKRIEHELALPHACSYETYDIQLRSRDDDDDNSSSQGANKSANTSSSTTSESATAMSKGRQRFNAKKMWGMFQRRKWSKSKTKQQSTKPYSKLNGNGDVTDDNPYNHHDFAQMAETAQFSDYLVPDDVAIHKKTQSVSSSSSSSSLYEPDEELLLMQLQQQQPYPKTSDSAQVRISSSSDYLIEGGLATTSAGAVNDDDNPLSLTPAWSKKQQEQQSTATYLPSLNPFDSSSIAIDDSAFDAVVVLFESTANNDLNEEALLLHHPNSRIAIEGLSANLFETFSSMDDDELLLADTNSTGMMMDGLEIKYGNGSTAAAAAQQTDSKSYKSSTEASSKKLALLADELNQSYDSRFGTTNTTAHGGDDLYPTNVWSSDDEEKKDDGMGPLLSFDTKPSQVHLHNPLQLPSHMASPSATTNPFDMGTELGVVQSILTSETTAEAAVASNAAATDQTVPLPNAASILSSNVVGLVVEPPVPPPPPPRPSSPVEESTKPMTAFERATAEILRVTGLEAMDNAGAATTAATDGQPNASASAAAAAAQQASLSPPDWITSAKHVFDNISSEVLKVAGLDRNEPAVPNTPSNPNHANAGKTSMLSSPTSKATDPSQRPKRASGDEISRLFTTLVLPDVPPSEIEDILSKNPELPQVRRNRDGRLPLHVLCDRRMLDRTASVPVKKLTDYLLEDIANHKLLIRIVVEFYPNACLVLDKRQDLPVHLMARRLMEWEATWYETVYQRAAKEGTNASNSGSGGGSGSGGNTATAITKLYQTMSESIELLLQPLVENTEKLAALCRAPGSMGTILPLHIASIFTVSVKLLKLTLEGYPEGATIHCDLGILRTFIPDESLALELHDNLSTDFPKWEVEGSKQGLLTDAGAGAATNGQTDSGEEDTIRRSDLLFAYNPIEPYRLEKARIRRLESRIQYDATVMVGKTNKKLERSNERLWIWMCTFRERETDRPTYVNSVKRIVSVLPLQSLRHLISIKTEDGALLIDAANDECLKVIQRRLERISNETAGDDKETAPALKKVEDDEMKPLPYQETDFVAQLCRLVFNVPQSDCPTSFVILPYKLLRSENGSLRMSSPDSNLAAAKFAECLQNLTESQAILNLLDFKSRNQFSQSLFIEEPTPAEHRNSKNVRLTTYEDFLIALYRAGDAYLYLIDETTGLPQVIPADSKYPMHLTKPEGLVRKLLPLMMMGMVQMRGDKAIAKLASVVLDDSVEVIPPSWMEAAELLATYVDSPNATDPDLDGTAEAIDVFRSRFAARVKRGSFPSHGLSEWNEEIAVIRKLIEINNDPDRSIPGSFPTTTSSSQGQQSSTEDRKSSSAGSKSDGASNGNTSVVLQDESKSFVAQSPVSAIDSSFVSSEPDVIDLARKMDVLFEIQHRINHDSYQTLTEIVSQSMSFGADENDDEGSSASYHSDLARSTIDVASRYSLLFDDFSVAQGDMKCDSSADSEKNVRVWNSVDRVWEDVTLQLQSRAGTFCEDSQILNLKVALAEQARKLSDLGKRVSMLKDEERRFRANRVEVFDLTDVTDSDASFVAGDSLSEARRLVLRMGDLEERLICDEIQIQHLSMGAFTVEHEGDAMVTKLQSPVVASTQRPPRKPYESMRLEDGLPLDTIDRPRPPLNPQSLPARELSRISWGSASNLEPHSQRSFLLYEKSEGDVAAQNDSPQSTNPPKRIDAPFVVLDENSEDKKWYPVHDQTLPALQGSYKPMMVDTAMAIPSHYQDEKTPSDESSAGGERNYTVWERSGRVPSSHDDLARSPVSVPNSLILPSTLTKRQQKILDSPTSSSPSATKSVRFNTAQVDEPSRGGSASTRSQKLLATRKKQRYTTNLGDVYNRLATKQRAVEAIAEQQEPEGARFDGMGSGAPVEGNAYRHAFTSLGSANSGVSSVFRPANTITFSAYQVPQRELSTLSSDRSHTSEVYNARRVMEIEELISKYTAQVGNGDATGLNEI